jgi:hypothetical protein
MSCVHLRGWLGPSDLTRPIRVWCNLDTGVCVCLLCEPPQYQLCQKHSGSSRSYPYYLLMQGQGLHVASHAFRPATATTLEHLRATFHTPTGMMLLLWCHG